MADTIKDGEKVKPFTIEELKINLANVLIHRVTLTESLGVIKSACLNTARESIDKADEGQLKAIRKDVDEFIAAKDAE